jgi:hypothetical protein
MRKRDRQGSHLPTTRRRTRVWPLAIAAVLLAVAVCFLWTAVSGRDRRSAEERLAEIEAARAIPDFENAAIIYNELLQDPKAKSILDDLPSSSANKNLSRILREPWVSGDLPEFVDWVGRHQFIIDRLLEASRFEKCRFPISIDVANAFPVDRLASMRQWGYLLTIAANNDVAEGQIDAALTKWRCLAQIDNHLRQQPTHVDHLTGMGMMRFAWESMARLIVEGAPAEIYLRKIEAMPVVTAHHAGVHLTEASEIDRLIKQKVIEDLGPFGRAKYEFVSRVVFRHLSVPDRQAEMADLYLRHTATASGIRILSALRRHKNTTGHWPTSLDEIRSSLPAEILTDPLNKGPFIYKPATDTFRLYSKGKNGIDEDGRTRHGEDFKIIEDDLALWPLPVPEPESPDDEETRKKQLEAIYGSDPN